MIEDLEVARYALRTFRLWAAGRYPGTPLRLEEHMLGPVSVFEPTAWVGGVCEARCIGNNPALQFHPEQHTAPELGCTCGIYGSHSLHHLREQFDGDITAVIAAEGRTIIGTRGLRTQYARVIAWHCANPELVRVAARQFTDAQQYPNLHQMCNDYGLPPRTDVPDDDNAETVSRWWTG